MQTATRFHACVTVLALLAGVSPAEAKYAGGTGTPADPYQIATAADLILLGESPGDYDKHFVLTAGIDLDPGLPGRKVFTRAVIAPDANEADPRFNGMAFTGNVDGRGHTISHLTMVGHGYLGLFGKLHSGSVISNLGMSAVAVNGTGTYVGSLAGSNGGTIVGCYAFGAVTGTDKCVGGLVGENEGSISASQTAGVVAGWTDVGGLVGINRYGAGIATSHSTDAVNGSSGGSRVGGLVGSAYGSIISCYCTGAVRGGYAVGGLLGAGQDLELMTCCYSTGAVVGYGAVGGLIGYIDTGDVNDCYSLSAVRGNDAVGGLVGYTESCAMRRCYSASAVGGRSNVGGLVGIADFDAVAICLWDVQVGGLTTSDGGVGRTTAEMQTAATFLSLGWDFVGETANGTEDTWRIDEGKDYPRLAWEPETGD